MTPAEIVERYLNEKAPSWSKSMWRQAERALSDFLRFTDQDVIISAHVLAYVMDLKTRTTREGRPLAPRSIQDWLRCGSSSGGRWAGGISSPAFLLGFIRFFGIF